jgi:hypothetical protein
MIRQIEALGLAAINALEPTKGEQVLDIGCGCGQTSLALADRVGSTAPWSALIFRPRCLRSRSIARYVGTDDDLKIKSCGRARRKSESCSGGGGKKIRFCGAMKRRGGGSSSLTAT